MGRGARRAPQRGQGATVAAACAVAALLGFGSLGLGQAYEITSEMKLEYGALAASGETRPPPPPPCAPHLAATLVESFMNSSPYSRHSPLTPTLPLPYLAAS